MSGLQIVYVLTNPAMPGLVKVGRTTLEEVDGRMKQLFSTGVPVPFDCAFACRVPNSAEVEKALHHAFGNVRVNTNREFFRIEADRVIFILKLLHVEDATQEVESVIEADATKADLLAAESMKKRRPRMDFAELQIPVGSALLHKNGVAQVTVFGAKTVQYEGQECSLTSATRKVHGLADSYPLQPSPFWSFNGKTVQEIYEDWYAELEAE